MTYSAFTNQFVNCKLSSVNYDNAIIIEENKIQLGLSNLFEIYLDKQYYEFLSESANFSLFYETLRNEMFSNFELKYKKNNSGSYTIVNRYSNKYFEVQLLVFSNKIFYDPSHSINTIINNTIDEIEYSRGDYFLDQIKSSLHIDIQQSIYPENIKQKIKFYQLLNYFRNKLISNKLEYSSSNLNFSYFNNTPNNLFDENDNLLFNELRMLASKDTFLQNGIFEFIRVIDITSFYRKLIEDFFITKNGKIPVGDRNNIKKIISIKPLVSQPVNLIEPNKYQIEEIDEEFLIENYGSLEEFNIQQEKINEILNS